MSLSFCYSLIFLDQKFIPYTDDSYWNKFPSMLFNISLFYALLPCFQIICYLLTDFSSNI